MFDELVDRLWRWMLEDSPEFATYVGERATGWTDYSPEACAERRIRRAAFLDELRALPDDGLDAEQQVTRAVVDAYLAAEVGVDAFPHEANLVEQMNGVHLGIAQTLEYQGTADVDAYVERLRAVPRLLDQTATVLSYPGLVSAIPARVVLADVPRQVRALQPADGPLAGGLAAAIEAMRREVTPALERFERFVVEELIPNAREEVGLSCVPGGYDWYLALIQQQTSLRLEPQEIHELGLAEVDRIWAAMEDLAGGDVAGFRRQLHEDPATYFATADDQLQAYRALCKEVDATLWQVVTRLPRTPYGVDPMPDYMAESAPTAYYIPCAHQARRPGTFIVNGHDLASRPSWRMVPLALHEAVPGHHLQIAIADELTELPPIRRHLGWNSYVEGWGLYAEHLGEELGFYRTDADRYGRLSFDMWRAARLVVDTGIHAFGWDRARAIAYMSDKTGLGDTDVAAEVDRYIAWPAQALGYKLGEQTILALRREAEATLGTTFVPAELHDIILRSGPLPLPLLQSQVRAWLRAR